MARVGLVSPVWCRQASLAPTLAFLAACGDGGRRTAARLVIYYVITFQIVEGAVPPESGRPASDAAGRASPSAGDVLTVPAGRDAEAIAEHVRHVRLAREAAGEGDLGQWHATRRDHRLRARDTAGEHVLMG